MKNKWKLQEKLKIESIMLSAGVIIILAIGLYNINVHYCLTIINDEFAYWANAAQMAGKDWTALMSTSSFYSYGYSLLLVPLFWLNISMITVYRLAIIMNALLLAGSFLLTYWLARQLFGHNGKSNHNMNRIDNRLLVFVSLIVTLYTSNIFQMAVAWTEIALYFTFWAAAVLVYRVVLPVISDKEGQKPKIYDALLLAVAAVYIYTIHNRALGVTVTVFALILFIYIKSLIEKKAQHILLICLVAMIGLFYLASVFRQFTIENWYEATALDNIAAVSRSISINDYSGQVSKIRRLVTMQGIVNLLLSLSGKVYYQATASFLLIFLPIFSIIGLTVKDMLMWIKRKPFKKWDIGNWVILFCSLSFVMEVGISALYKSGAVERLRAVDVLYGRYSEFAAGPLLLFAIAMLILKKNLLKEVAAGAFVYLLCAVSVGYQLQNVSRMFLNINNATAVFPYFSMHQDPLIITLIMTVAGFGGFVLVAGCAMMIVIQPSKKGKNNKADKVQKIIIFTAVSIIGLFWCISGMSMANSWVTRNGEGARSSMRGIMTAMSEMPEDTVMYYVDTPGDMLLNYIKIYQSLDPGREIHFIVLDEALNNNRQGNNVFITGIHKETIESLGSEMEGVMLTGGLALFAPRD
ncbi:MAG: hypothetical protein FWE14_07395 [Lachnospiraceae bacterium]|nr:hypothetical protein [Lachnospiraceae bacterium]